MSGVTIATSLLRSTWDFLNLSFQMLSDNKILKVFKSKIWLNPILPGLLNTFQTRGGVFYPPPNSLVFILEA